MKLIHNFILIFVLVLCLVSVSEAASAKAPDMDHSHGPSHIVRQSLLNKYHEVKKELEKSPFAVPFFIESSVSKTASHVDIYGTFKYPFDIVQNELLVPRNCCEILLPHPNVRACTNKKGKDTWRLNVYNVIKFSEPLEDAYHLKFEYRVNVLQARYFDVSLAAPDGPFHTKDHEFGLEAIPLDKDTTFLHLRYSYGYSSLTYLLMKLFGGRKIGFSVTGMDSSGNPVYVDGLRGSVERNVACYYIALLAHLDAHKVPAEQRFERRISQWYDLAGRYKEQLLEMEKEEYLVYKRRDLESQQRLQETLGK
ncbi:MAG TPA: hypothetical protein VN328_11880 [Thermodesulfovibrionales bacterium]|nr:hypothetical protein [Thermodesulfovibrionales bacterium]